MPKMRLREALSRGLTEALDGDERVVLLGEDIGKYQGSYAVTKGFFEKYGEDRIKDTPISEAGIVGCGIGSAMAGLRPIVEIMTINFLLMAIDQVVNHAAKLRYMSNGQISVPLVIRTVTGGGAQLAATHSQSLEGWLASVPGLKVVVPSNPYDALGLLRTSIEDNDPVIFAEHALLYGTNGEVPEEYYSIPFGKAAIKRPGTDVTLVAYSKMVHESIEAANKFEDMGVSAEVIDLRTLRPLDTNTVFDSVKKTNRVVIVEEAWQTGGFSGELVSAVQEECFDYLDGPVGRVSGLDVPAPYNRTLEASTIPDSDKIIETVRRLYGI